MTKDGYSVISEGVEIAHIRNLENVMYYLDTYSNVEIVPTSLYNLRHFNELVEDSEQLLDWLRDTLELEDSDEEMVKELQVKLNKIKDITWVQKC